MRRYIIEEIENCAERKDNDYYVDSWDGEEVMCDIYNNDGEVYKYVYTYPTGDDFRERKFLPKIYDDLADAKEAMERLAGAVVIDNDESLPKNIYFNSYAVQELDYPEDFDGDFPDDYITPNMWGEVRDDIKAKYNQVVYYAINSNGDILAVALEYDKISQLVNEIACDTICYTQLINTQTGRTSHLKETEWWY